MSEAMIDVTNNPENYGSAKISGAITRIKPTKISHANGKTYHVREFWMTHVKEIKGVVVAQYVAKLFLRGEEWCHELDDYNEGELITVCADVEGKPRATVERSWNNLYAWDIKPGYTAQENSGIVKLRGVITGIAETKVKVTPSGKTHHSRNIALQWHKLFKNGYVGTHCQRLEAKGFDKCEWLDNYQVGDTVDVVTSLQGWTYVRQEGEDVFNTLSIEDINLTEETEQHATELASN